MELRETINLIMSSELQNGLVESSWKRVLRTTVCSNPIFLDLLWCLRLTCLLLSQHTPSNWT